MRTLKLAQNEGESVVVETVKSKPSLSLTPTANLDVRKDSLSLPLVKKIPSPNLDRSIILLYGEPKIGKSGFAAQFNTIFFAFEAGHDGIEAYIVELHNMDTAWAEFKAYVDLLLETPDLPYTRVSIDTFDLCVKACERYIYTKKGIEHASDLTHGKGWDAIKSELMGVINKLKSKFGVTYISHAQEKELYTKLGGTYHKITSTLGAQGKSLASSDADVTIYFGYHGNERYLTITGSESVESGTRLGRNFWVKDKFPEGERLILEKIRLKEEGNLSLDREEEINKQIFSMRVRSIPAGIDPREAYANYVRAFNNLQPDNGQPEKAAVLSDKPVPMTKKK